MGMSPYEALYGRRCRTPVTWDNPVNQIVLGPELLKEMEQEVVKIRQKLKAAQVKVQWEHYGPEEATWELEDAMRLAHPSLFNFAEH